MKCKIKLSKTVQERQYEPYSISFENEFTIQSMLTPTERGEVFQKNYDQIEKQIDAWIETRLQKVRDNL